MKGQIRWAMFLAISWSLVLWNSDYAIAESRDEEVVRPLNKQLSCQEMLAKADEAIDAANVRDAQAARISGFPYYRVNRFLASFSEELNHDNARKEWLTRMLRLGNEARRIELTNLPKEFLPKLPPEFSVNYLVAEIERCAAQALAEDLNDTQRMKQLRELIAVPDGYNTMVRTVGLNPVSSWFVMGEIVDLQDEARNDFQRPEAMGGGKIQWYVPDRPRPEISNEKLAAILKQARDKSALGIPEPDPEELLQLFDSYAPVWRVSTKGESDRIGRPYWRDDDQIGVDTTAAVVYRYHSYTRMEDKMLLQLNYLIWFSERPAQGWFDILSGHLDGLIWRVTLDHQGRVLLYDSVHPCGCYHKYYPVSPHIRPLKDPPTPEPPLILAKDIPTYEKGRVVIHLKGVEHYVVGLTTQVEQVKDGISYQFDKYSTLRNLPYRGAHRSMFNPDGVVMGTERAERWLVWPTSGLPYAGAMRQKGHYALSLIGRRHFDDPRLFESAFQLQQ